MKYNYEDFIEMGLQEDTLSSIEVPEGYSVILYDYRSFQRHVLEIVHGAYKNRDSQELLCQNLQESTLGKVSSFEIVKSGGVMGYWQGITSTETQEYQYHVGISYGSEDAISHEVQNTLSLSMELGFKFFGLKNKWKLTGETKDTLTHDVKSTYGLDY